MRGTVAERLADKQIIPADTTTIQSNGLTPCYGWKGARTGRYQRPVLKVAGKNEMAYRVAYILEIGPIPPGQFCLHTCDNEECTRVSHLYLGSALRNAMDRKERGRQHTEGYLRGEDHPNAHLTDADVADIRRLWKSGQYTQRSIADMFGVSSSATVSNLVRGITRAAPTDSE